MERLILDSKVILCTLSMMLNPKLRDNGTLDIVPPRCLVIDEASQINAFEFMVTRVLHLLSTITYQFPATSRFLTHSEKILRKSVSSETPANVLFFSGYQLNAYTTTS